MRCMQLVYQHLRQSSLVLRQTADRAVLYNELASLNADNRHVTSTTRVLWTCGSRQLAVLPSQVKLLLSHA